MYLLSTPIPGCPKRNREGERERLVRYKLVGLLVGGLNYVTLQLTSQSPRRGYERASFVSFPFAYLPGLGYVASITTDMGTTPMPPGICDKVVTIIQCNIAFVCPAIHMLLVEEAW